MGLVDRWYGIINILEISSSISEEKLQKELKVSQKTLEKSIKLLNKEVSGIARISSENKKYFLEIFDIKEYEKILSGKLKEESDFNSISKRVAFILKEIIENKKPLLISDLSENLNVSRGTVVNDLNRLRKELELYNLEIIGKPNIGLEIKGKEYEIWLAYIYIVLDYFTSDYSFEEDNQRILNKIHSLTVPKEAIDLLLKVIEVTFIRIDNNHFIDQKIEHYQNFLKDSNLFQELISFLEIEYGMTLSDFERNFISYPLNVYNKGNEMNKKYDFSFTQKLFDEANNEIQKAFALKIDKSILFEEIRVHLIYLINRLVMHVESRDIIIEQLNLKYPLSHAISEVFGNVLSNKLDVSIPDIEINYLSLYFEMMINPKNKGEEKEIAIICHTGYGTSKIIKNQIQYILGSGVEITTYAYDDVEESELNKYFAIFSTIPLRRKNLTVPTIQIDTVFDDGYVRKEWEKAIQHNLVDFDRLKLYLSTVDLRMTYKENLDAMIDRLLEENEVDEHFKQKILEREKIKSTLNNS